MDEENDINEMFKNVEEVRPDGEQPLHFYYNREERIAKAPPQVQEYYRGGMRPVKGFKVFFTKQNRYIFIALLFFVGVTFVYNGFSKTRDSATLGGVDFELTANRFRDEVYVRVAMERNRKVDDNIPVSLVADIFSINGDNQVQDKQQVVWVYNEGEEFIETKFPDYDIIRIDIMLKIGDEEKEISSIVRG